VTEEILHDNLEEEVCLTLQEGSTLVSATGNNDFHLWQEAIKGLVCLETRKYPSLSVSFDMAWQQRSSGNRYASPSGHALLVGRLTRKPIALCIKSKRCNFCFAWMKNTKTAELPMADHDCLKNHDGSSGSMEPISCLEMVTFLYDNKFCKVARICCDDDASTRSLLKWSNADHMKNNNSTERPMAPITKGKNKGKMHERPDKGKLRADIPEPLFVADPNHR
jgi:hypothetical protein